MMNCQAMALSVLKAGWLSASLGATVHLAQHATSEVVGP